jgi:hypothetical protein
MYNDTLNHLRTQVFPADIRDCDRLKTHFRQHLETAVSLVESNDYVEDCLFQIDEALERLCESHGESLDIRNYLLGAIEALRDELHLCQVQMNVRQTAVGY